MKRFRVITHPIVEDEINEAYLFIAAHSPDNANRWANGIENASLSLSVLPTRCPLAIESAEFNKEIRHLIVGSYRILFTIDDDEVHVLHVHHSARKSLDPHNN